MYPTLGRQANLSRLHSIDGYQDFAEVAWPLLKRYGFGATVYLPTDHVGGRAEWDGKHGEPAPLMDWTTVCKLAREGVCFGSHGCSHRSLTTLPSAELTKEVRGSREVMREVLGTFPSAFCFPYADFDPVVIDAVREAGYDYAVAGFVARDLTPNRYALRGGRSLGM